MSLSDPLIIKDQFGIIQNLHMSPIPQTNFLVETFFATSYSKTALVQHYTQLQDDGDREWAWSELFSALKNVVKT